MLISIVLNLKSVKYLLCLPNLTCLNIGEPVSRKHRTYITKNIGVNISNPKNDSMISISLIILFSI